MHKNPEFEGGWRKRKAVRQCVGQETRSAEYGEVILPRFKRYMGWAPHAYRGQSLKELRQGYFAEMTCILNDVRDGFKGFNNYRENYLSAVGQVKKNPGERVAFAWIGEIPETKRLVKKWEGDPLAPLPRIPQRLIEKAARKTFNRLKRR
jgi:hypothetical protein